MPSFDEKGGFHGAVGEHVPRPGWSPTFTDEQRVQEQRDEAERRKYLSAESQRQQQKFELRRPSTPLQPT